MRDAMGVGLAATQLGALRRLLVFQAGPDATPTAVANPLIEWLSDELATAEEGCLSLPRDRGRRRARRCTRGSRGVDVDGEPLLLEASGLEARVLQHEIDHLDGVLILDRTEREQRKGAMRALREGTSYSPAPSPRPTSPTTGEGRLPRHLGLRRRRAARARRETEHRPALVVTPPDRRRGRGRRLAPAPVAAAAEELGIELLRDRGDRGPGGAGGDRAPPRPELGVVCAFGQLLREPLLDRLELLNVHPSLCRAGAARRRSSARSWPATSETGVTIMRVTEGLDSGPIALAEAIEIGDDDFGRLSPRLERLGGRLLVEALDRRARGELELVTAGRRRGDLRGEDRRPRSGGSTPSARRSSSSGGCAR